MKFQTRLLFRYSLLVFLLVVILATTFYAYTARLFENNAASTYRLLTSRMSLHLNNLIRPMDFITTNLISDGNFRSALTILATLDRGNPRNEPFINEAAQTITSDLLTYSIQKSFYSVVVVTKGGAFFSSNFINHRQVSSEQLPLAELPGYGAARAAGGRAVLVPPHDDPWDSSAKVRVYGLARLVPGPEGDLAFMEVQNPIQDLNTLFRVPDQRFVRILALQADGIPFYESKPTPPELVAHYFKEAATGGHGFQSDPLTGQSELLIGARSSYTGVTIILVLDRAALLRPLAFVAWVTAGISVLIILASVFYNWIASAQLAKPLRLIRKRMEETELSNLPGEQPIDHENDEIAALDRSFQRLRTRLDDAISRELRSRTLSLQARLDSLQAQVNPHFLYNILTVIAGKGLELGNEEIAEICDAIAAMLRYSTSTAARTARIAEEVAHTRAYLFLMKKRYEERLHFEFDVSSELLDVAVPKIVLQQIVENSLNHGFQDGTTPMHIVIRGFRAGNRWVLEISDNGCGFDAAVLDELRARMAAFAAEPASRGEDGGLSIGGLGLLNTFIRLHLFYRGDFLWKMENGPGGGAHVVVGGPMLPSHWEENDVYDSARRG